MGAKNEWMCVCGQCDNRSQLGRFPCVCGSSNDSCYCSFVSVCESFVSRVRLLSVRATYADPGVFESLCSSDAFTGIDSQHLVDQVFGLWSYSVPLRGRELPKKMQNVKMLIMRS